MKYLLLLLIPFSLNALLFEATGNTHLYFHDKKEPKSIECFEPVFVDLKQNKLQCLSINPLFSKQVHYQDDQNDVLADNLMIDFTTQNHSFSLTNLSLLGHVRVKQRVEGEKCFRYALSDQLDYNPKAEEIVLISNQGRNVLYFDETNDTKMKAPKVRISEIKKSNKPKIEGLGDVSFTFKQDELSSMEKNFKKK